MGPVDAVRSVLRQYATFGGRARRSEYWWFALFTAALGLLCAALDVALFGSSWTQTGPLSLVSTLALLIPSLAVAWRRLHDTDRSGAWNLIALVPLIGWIVLLVFTVSDSTAGTNRFGPSPKGTATTGGSASDTGTGHRPAFPS